MSIVRFKFKLGEYFIKSQRVLYFFETLMETKNIDQQKLLNNMDIVYTSFKFAQKKEQNIGRVIVHKLSEYFKFMSLTNELIFEYETFLSKLYEDIYYKNYNNIVIAEKTLNEYVKQNTILLPIFKVFQILLQFMNNNYTIKENQEKCREYFQELSKYYKFFTDEINAVYTIIKVLMSDNVVNMSEVLSTANKIPYFRGMIYFVLTTNAYVQKDYEKVIIYGQMCVTELKNEHNFSRLLSIDLLIAVSFNVLDCFELSYDICVKNILTMESLNISKVNYESALSHFYVACLGLKKYDELLNIILPKESKSEFEYLVLMFISYKNKHKDQLDFYYNELRKIVVNNKVYDIISKSVYDILISKKVKESLINIENIFNIGFIRILKMRGR